MYALFLGLSKRNSSVGLEKKKASLMCKTKMLNLTTDQKDLSFHFNPFYFNSSFSFSVLSFKNQFSFNRVT